MDGIFFALRTGTPWRDLPKDYGPYSTCYNRYNRWSKKGLWEKILEDFQKLVAESAGRGDGGGGARPIRSRMIDSSTVRVHRHAAGSRKDSGPREMGRSRGGLTTKIHAMVDEGGQPRRMHLSPGQASDCGGAVRLLEGLEAGTLPIADKAYDTNSILEQVAATGCTVAIPSKSNRRIQRPLDAVAYAGRNVIERFFGRTGSSGGSPHATTSSRVTISPRSYSPPPGSCCGISPSQRLGTEPSVIALLKKSLGLPFPRDCCILTPTTDTDTPSGSVQARRRGHWGAEQ